MLLEPPCGLSTLISVLALTLLGPLSSHHLNHSLLVQQRPDDVHWGLMASSRGSVPKGLGSFLNVKQVSGGHQCPSHCPIHTGAVGILITMPRQEFASSVLWDEETGAQGQVQPHLWSSPSFHPPFGPRHGPAHYPHCKETAGPAEVSLGSWRAILATGIRTMAGVCTLLPIRSLVHPERSLGLCCPEDGGSSA